MLEITKTKSQPDESQLICNAFSSCAPSFAEELAAVRDDPEMRTMDHNATMQ